MSQAVTLHDISIPLLQGGKLDFASFKGRHILLVNVASECGYTSQYQALQELHHLAADRIAIVGIPCHDFGNQEPGSPEEIIAFCSNQFGVTFPLTQKVSILGPQQHPLYHWLTHSEANGVSDAVVRWNFTKFVLSPQGTWLGVFPSAISPLDSPILEMMGLNFHEL